MKFEFVLLSVSSHSTDNTLVQLNFTSADGSGQLNKVVKRTEAQPYVDKIGMTFNVEVTY